MADLLLLEDFYATPERAIWHLPTRTLIFSDLHLGWEADITRSGQYMPDFSLRQIEPVFRALLERAPNHILIAGDLFHSASPTAETVDAARGLLQLAGSSCSITMLPGNHDPEIEQLGLLFEGTRVRTAGRATVGGFGVFHGHQWGVLPGDRGVVVGHQHPAVTFRNRVQSAKMLCFATVTPTTGLPIIILPHFSAAPIGSNLFTGRYWILDTLRPPASQIRIAGLVDGRVLDFGPLDRQE